MVVILVGLLDPKLGEHQKCELGDLRLKKIRQEKK